MTRRRYELTDRERLIIEPLLSNKPRDVSRVDDRRVLNGTLWRFRLARHRPRCPSATAPRRLVTTGLSAGVKPGCGIGFWLRFPPLSKARS